MFSFLFRKPAKPAPMIIDDIPAHRGFVVYVTLPNGKTDSHAFDTLRDAQVYLFQRKGMARDVARAMGYRAPSFRRYAIRNLETGKFAPYLWQLTRADVAA